MMSVRVVRARNARCASQAAGPSAGSMAKERFFMIFSFRVYLSDLFAYLNR